MLYDALNYGAQVTVAARRHRLDKDTESDGEFLSGFTKSDKLVLDRDWKCVGDYRRF